jgi:hypothetical protein
LAIEIRMEVAFVKASEMFSWPGAADFETNILEKLPPTGAGGFGGWTRSLFGQTPAHGDECTVEGRHGLGYNFSVPAESSNYADADKLEDGDKR